MDDSHHALHVLRDQRQDRARFASSIDDGLARTTFYSIDHVRLIRTMRQAMHEDEQYQTLTGEPMTDEHRQVLRIELSYWMEYDDLLRAPTVPEDHYERFCADLRPRAAQLNRLLAVEEEMLGSPLVAHYGNQVGRITGGTAPADPTRNPLRALVQLRESRQERGRLAHLTYRHLLRGTFFDAGTTDLSYALHHGKEDRAFFEDSTGEQYPPYAMRANEFEQRLWSHLLAVHEQGASNRARSCRRLTPLARILERTLELQDDLLTTPLSAYYERQLHALAQAAQRADKRFTTGGEA